MFKLADFRAYVPNGVKHALKPYFRSLLPITLNARPIVCTLPCRAACDRDFTSFKRLKSKPTAAVSV